MKFWPRLLWRDRAERFLYETGCALGCKNQYDVLLDWSVVVTGSTREHERIGKGRKTSAFF